jgi:hypothetical protein
MTKASPSQTSLKLRSFLADTTALILFFTLTGALNERYITGMS